MGPDTLHKNAWIIARRWGGNGRIRCACRSQSSPRCRSQYKLAFLRHCHGPRWDLGADGSERGAGSALGGKGGYQFASGDRQQQKDEGHGVKSSLYVRGAKVEVRRLNGFSIIF